MRPTAKPLGTLLRWRRKRGISVEALSQISLSRHDHPRHPPAWSSSRSDPANTALPSCDKLYDNGTLMAEAQPFPSRQGKHTLSPCEHQHHEYGAAHVFAVKSEFPILGFLLSTDREEI